VAASRRMGSIDSAMGASMLDAAEVILREEGYAALTSRRVAEYSGVKQRLVYYYFRTMEELTVETFRRLSARELARLRTAIASEHPLHEVWAVCINTSDARMVAEFMAIANRSEAVRKQVVSFIRESRRLQVAALKAALADRHPGTGSKLNPSAIAFMGTSLALALNRESALGIRQGHAEVGRMIREFFGDFEP